MYMNKLIPFLAFVAFALVACSEDKPELTQTEICSKRPITKECLVGRWDLKSMEVVGYPSSGCGPASGDYLELEKKGRFTFSFTSSNGVRLEKLGIWELIDGGMKITFDGGDYNRDDPNRINPIDSQIDIRSGPELIIVTKNYSAFLQCNASSATFTEVFGWRGKIK